MSDEFTRWLARELEARKWSQRELARQSGLSQGIISQTLSGAAAPSADFCIKVAQTFVEPPEKLLRLAGILPPITPDDPTLQELIDLAKNMSPEDQQELLKYARFRFQQG